MRQSLVRTWIALGVAAAAVLVVAILTGRDVSRDLFAECPSRLVLEPDGSPPFAVQLGLDEKQAAKIERLKRADILSDEDYAASRPFMRIAFDEKLASKGTALAAHVRVEQLFLFRDGTSRTCGSVPVDWAAHAQSLDPPSVLEIYRDTSSGLYAVIDPHGRPNTPDRPRLVSVFRAADERTRYFQPSLIVTMKNLPVVIALLSAFALVVALLRSRHAMAYALRLHTWTEARLTSQGRLEDDNGSILANVDSSITGSRRQWPIPVGAVLVSPDALREAEGGLYRAMPVVGRRDLAAGSHRRWTTATMTRLRDARALAVISVLATALAYAARAFGS